MWRVTRPIESPVPALRRSRSAAAACGILLAILFATPASAHDDTGLAGGFLSGFAHPLSGFDHALAMVAVGLWGAILGRPLVIALPIVFPLMMAFGGATGIAGVPLPPVELGIAISVVTLGLMVLLAVRAPVLAACTIVAIFALFHGFAHGRELPAAADPVGYSLGFVASTGLLHVIGIALGYIENWRIGAIALRTAGGAIAVAGLWYVQQALAS